MFRFEQAVCFSSGFIPNDIKNKYKRRTKNSEKHEFCQAVKNLTMKYIQKENHSNHLT